MASPALFISNLKYRYDDATAQRRWTVEVASLELQAGEQMLLTGGSGTGKSTLLHLIAGLLDPFEGVVSVGGQSVHALSGATRDRFRGSRIGMIFQSFNLLHGFTATENVQAALMFGSTAAGDQRARARALLTRLGIEDAERPVDRLSVGQQQRVAVARALAAKPTLVLADEPTASLDPENGASAIELIQSVCRENNAALLCVSHDPALPARFERCVGLADLRVVRARAGADGAQRQEADARRVVEGLSA